MRTLFRGKDKGFAVLSAIALIFFAAAMFFSLAPQLLYVKKKTQRSVGRVIEAIEAENTRLRKKYELH